MTKEELLVKTDEQVLELVNNLEKEVQKLKVKLTAILNVINL